MIALIAVGLALQVIALTTLAMSLIDTARILNQQAEILRRLGIELELLKGPVWGAAAPAAEDQSSFSAPDEARFSTDTYLAAAAGIDLDEEAKK